MAAGSWLPHEGLRTAEINNYPFNCSESNRMWNRCDSQSQTKEFKGSTLKYRKIQDLEQDPLFLVYMQKALFRDLTAKIIGEHVSAF